ncbi:MAG: hypothetical protein ACF8PN_00310 [Phycisphaerales bacterium]
MVTNEADGTVTFQIYLPDARHVAVSGEFNGWSRTSHTLNRTDDGWWRLRLALPAGDFRFQYLVDRRDWLADFAASGVELNSFGAWVSRVVISPRPLRVTPVATADAWLIEADEPGSYEAPAPIPFPVPARSGGRRVA